LRYVFVVGAALLKDIVAGWSAIPA
jgi:hypothetical protein